MLLNPFTPSEIASHPEDFFGRVHELKIMERSLMQGSIAIGGAIGIGKSSLLARACTLMEGFKSSHRSVCARAICHKDIKSLDDAARLVLEDFVSVDHKSNKLKISLGKVVEIESSEVRKYFAEGRHLAALTRILEKQYLDMILANQEYLILAVDEADKCPVVLAQLVRALTTHIQQAGVKRVRFVVAGVSPFFQKMVDEDQGVSRFFYKVLTLTPMPPDEADELVLTKLDQVVEHSRRHGFDLTVERDVIDRVVALSGGHPHILQLLGSHLVEHENEDPDGVIDARDLVTSLRSICYEDRAHVYDSSLHLLAINNRLDALQRLFDAADAGFPTRISTARALEVAEKDDLEWLVAHNILAPINQNEYGLIDEFLRIRAVMDLEESDIGSVEHQLINELKFEPYDDEMLYPGR